MGKTPIFNGSSGVYAESLISGNPTMAIWSAEDWFSVDVNVG